MRMHTHHHKRQSTPSQYCAPMRGLTPTRSLVNDCFGTQVKSMGRSMERIIREALAKVDPEGIRPIHISFDIDSIDPTFAGSTGTPVEDGLLPEEGMASGTPHTSPGSGACLAKWPLLPALVHAAECIPTRMREQACTSSEWLFFSETLRIEVRVVVTCTALQCFAARSASGSRVCMACGDCHQHGGLSLIHI